MPSRPMYSFIRGQDSRWTSVGACSTDVSALAYNIPKRWALTLIECFLPRFHKASWPLVSYSGSSA